MAKKPKPADEPSDLQRAAELIEQDKKRRAAAFAEELQLLCAKYGCELLPIVQVVPK